MRRAPTTLDHFDIDEADDVVFRFGKNMNPGETIAQVDVTVRSVSTQVVDPSPESIVASPYDVIGTDVVQRIDVRSRQAGAQYVVRVGATLAPSGRVLVAAAHVAVVQL